MSDSQKDSIAATHVRYLLEAIIGGEKGLADNILEKWAKENGYRSAIVEVLEPALEQVGRLWDQEKISLAAGYLAGKVAEDILNKAIVHEQNDLPHKGTAVIGNIEDDYHSLGRKLVGIFLSAAGWKVIDLGNDVTPSEFVDAALAHDAQVIGASAMMHTTAVNILGVRKEIEARQLGDRLKLAVGGAIFKVRPDLVQEVGGDGTAANAVDAPALFDRLKGELA
jgi:methanogenic corrinoid protein MtbC1